MSGSCPCNLQIENRTNINVGIPTNKSVGNCNFKAPGLRKFPVFSESEQPIKQPKNSTYKWNVGNINTVEMSQLNPDYKQVNCGRENAGVCRKPEESHGKGCNDTVYISQDPRLMDPIRNSLIKLDRPPFRSTFFIQSQRYPSESYTDIYESKYNDFGQNYRTYNDITAGQITYYIDPLIEDPYFSPNFTIDSQVQGVLYRDPMGSLKPTFVRKAVSQPDEKYNPLSSIRDSAVFREDIMASNMAQMNQKRWSNRWGQKAR